MATEIRLRRGAAAAWTAANPTLASGEVGYESDTRKLKVGDGSTAWASLPYFVGNLPGATLNDLGDVTITDAANGDFLRWNGSAWINDAVNLSTDTVGDYVNTVTASTGVTITGAGGESSSPVFSIGQDVATTASVTFAQVTAPLNGNANTASTLQTSRTISLSGDVSGSVSFNGSQNVDISATIQPNSVALGTDTTGNYVNDVVSGTGVTVTHTPGEGSSASIAIGQDVGTSASVQFGQVTTTGDVTVGGNLTVNGTTTTLNTETLAIEDNIVLLNSNVTGSPTTNAGIEVERGDSSNVVLRWNESTDSWEVTEDGSTYKNIAVGQDVETTSSVSFASITGPLTGNADTASALQTARTIELSGDISGSASFDGSSSISISTSIQPNSVALGTDTTGNYVADIVQGTGVLITHTPGEGSSASIALNADLNDLNDVSVIDSTEGQLLIRTAEGWQNVTASGDVTVNASGAFSIAANSVELGTDTTGNYVNDIVAGTGVTVTHTPGEGSSASIAIGQDVSTTASVDFNRVYTDTLDVFGDSILNNIKSRSEPYITTVDFRTPSADRNIYIPDADGNFAIVSSSTGVVALGTDTTGNYVANVVQGSGILVTHTPGEGSSASIALNAGLNELSDVSVVDPIEGDLLIRTAEGWQNLPASGDVTVNASGVFSIAANSVALGTDTTGNYMSDVYAGTGVTINHTAGEGSTASISIGQDVATSSSVTFAQVTASVVSVLTTPTNNSDAATKAYVDQVTAGINWHESVKYATAAALPNNPTYNVGSADQNNGTGIGTTYVAGTYGRLVIDGANASTGQRVLVKDQPDAEDNGVYVVTEQGSASVYWILTRASDSDNSVADQVKTGDAVYVLDGAVNANQGFIINSSGSEPNNVIRIGTDEITWTQFTGTAAFTAGNGLSTTGNTLNIGTADSGRIVVNADTIDLASVAQTNTTGTSGIAFVQSHSVDSYGRVTGTVTADVRDASTTQKGIAQFNSSQFSVSSGSVQIASGAITTTEIANGTITNSDISEEAGIGLLKLQSGSSGQIIVADASGVPSYVTPSGDVTVNASGVFSIAANSVALGTDTTGNYMTNIVGSGGIVVTHTPGEGSTASISFDPVITSSNAGSDTTSFISSITVNSNGQVTAYNTSSVQDASTTQKGIAQFNSNHFAVSSGSVSLATLSGDVTVDGSGVTAIGSGVIVNADINSAAAIALSKLASGTSGQVVLANSSGVPTYTTISGDITISDTGVATIAANSVALGTDTTGNYMSGVTASTGVTISHTAGEGSTATIAIGQPVGTTDNVTFNDVTVSGNLTINGTTTTVNSTTVTIDDPIFTLGGDSAPMLDDNKDRGIEFRYHTGLSACVGFFGYDDSSGRFIFFTGATNTSEVFSGTNASVQVGSLHIVGGPGAQDYIVANYDGSTASISLAATTDRMDLVNSSVFRGLHFVSTGGTNSGSLSYSTATNTFSFSRYISSASLSSALLTSASLSSASLSSASVVAPYISGSVQFDTSGSVTLPAKTFFPEEYLAVSSSVTLNATTHRYATLEMTASAGTSVITVPADASSDFPVGSVIQIIRTGAGEVQVTASAGVTVNNALGTRLRAQWSTATLRKRAADTWLLSGDLKV